MDSSHLKRSLGSPSVRRAPLLLTALWGLLAVLPAGAQCPTDWTPGFEMRGLSGSVAALEVCDFGNGPTLYAGGGIGAGSGQLLNSVATWNGSLWQSVGLGTNGPVTDLALIDFWTGPFLFASGSFTMAGGAPAGYLAKWDGVTWTSTGINTVASQPIVKLLAVPGSPATLYASDQGGRVHANQGGPWTTLGPSVRH